VIITVTPNPVLDRTLTVSELVLNEMSRAIAVREDWGGKGFNVSRALHALGMDSVAVGFLGCGVGQKLRAGLEQLGVVVNAIEIAAETRTNVVITESGGGRYVKVNEAGPTLTPAEVAQFFRYVDNSAKSGDIWALCGSLPPGVPDDFYARTTEVLHAAGAKVLLDASGVAFQKGLAAKPDVVKPNNLEAAAALGISVSTPTEAARAVDNFVDMGITLVALSLGPNGVMLGAGAQRVWARSPAVQALNPVGAGDALVAGLLWAWERGLALPDMGRWGVASGTAAAMSAGVSVGMREDVAALVTQVQLAAWPEA
jgi:1-phosphofructokinase family hexose kinase